MNDQSTTREPICAHDCHPNCIACRPREQGGMGLRFYHEPDGGVVGTVHCEEGWQGFPDLVHGGIIAVLLDEAMVHCLLARGARGVTARFDIKFRHPVRIGVEATVRARVANESPSFYEIVAEIAQAGDVRAVATGLLTREEKGR